MSGFPCPHCQADVPANGAACPSCARPPVVCGRYRLAAVLGKGGMGTVYDARDTADGSPVAVKLVTLKDGVDWKVFELFERGTDVLRQLHHPCLPKLHAFEKTEAGALVLVRERFDGASLEERVLRRQRRYSAAELRRMLETLLELLGYLHGRSPPVLHRDIKASNILFRTDADDLPVLVDFDTVAAPGDQTRRTTLVVSPGYTAPEQYAGDVSPASDLYSLGATMLLAATGTHPDELPRRDGRFVLDAQLRHLPDDLRAVILRLVEPERRNRHARAEEALQALRAKPTPEPRSRPQQPRPEVERSPSLEEPKPPEAAERKRLGAAPLPAPKVAGRPGTDAAKDGWRRPTPRQMLLGLGFLALGIPCFLVENLWFISTCATVSGFGVAFALIMQSAPKGEGGNDSLIASGVAFAILAGWIAGSMVYWKDRREEARRIEAQTAPGVLESVQLVPGAPGRLVVLGQREIRTDDSGRRSIYRIDLLDGAAGTRLVRRLFGERLPECVPTAVGRMWCKAGEVPLMALDLGTLETLAEWTEFRRNSGELAVTPQGPVEVEPVGGDALVPMSDGRTWRVGARDLLAYPLEEREYQALDGRLRRLDSTPPTDTHEAELDGVRFELSAAEGSQRQRLARNGEAVSADVFLAAWFVVDAGTEAPLRVPGPDALLVLHHTSLDARLATGLLSAVALDGRTVWTVPAPFQELELATVVADTVIVAGNRTAGPGVIVGLSATDGAELWRLAP